ncbi:MAG: NAD-dependent epimerase/dehydratase family protein [Deltaproteobacteria bacterium]|nr:NAD-dependent epimerase/dehydratase family protein [Deltaproteobacteria bacterium]
MVTGAGGFIGHHLSNRLVAEGADVFSIDRKHPEWGDHPSRDFMLVDLRCIEDFLSGQDFVFHLAAEMGGIGYIENNKGDIVSSSTRIDLNVLDASYRSKVGRFLYTSSACVYPGYRQNDLNNPGLRESDAYPADAEDGYGWQKLYTERLCRHYRKDFGLDTRIARLHNIFGPLGTYDGGREKAPAAMCRKIAMAKDGDPIEVWGDGKQTRSYCYVDDCVEGLIRLMLFDYNKPINIGTDEMVSVNKLIEHVEAVSGKKVKRVYDQTKPKGVRGRNANLDLVKVVLDWSPTRTLKEGLAETYPWIAEQVQK